MIEAGIELKTSVIKYLRKSYQHLKLDPTATMTIKKETEIATRICQEIDYRICLEFRELERKEDTTNDQ